MPTTRIVVRTATPWETMTYADFCAQHDPLLPAMVLRKERAALVADWQTAYGLDFCQYRAWIRDACQRRLMAIGVDHVTLGLRDFESWLYDGREEILFTIDDDDTFEPSILDVANQFDSDTALVVWKRRTHHLGKVQSERWSRYTDTCNWAVRKSFVARYRPGEASQLLAFHWLANGLIARELNIAKTPRFGVIDRARAALQTNADSILASPAIKELDGCHSTYYLHTGSISFLVGGKMAKHTDTVQYLRELPLHPLYKGN